MTKKPVREVAECEGCPLRNKFPDNTFVSPQLPDPAKDLVRLVIAEAPGREEQKQGKPLVGSGGHVFDSLLSDAGIDRDGLTIVNCINCRPPKNIFPTDRRARDHGISKEEGAKAEKQCYERHVLPLLRSRRWRRVDLIGSKALRIVAGEPGRITEWRGRPVPVLGTSNAIAIFHPSYLRRFQRKQPGKLREAVEDLRKALPEY
jgi:uracil-DNA glycosylase